MAQFPISVALQNRIAKSASPAVKRSSEMSTQFPTTAKTSDAAPLGNDVLRQAAGFWKASKNANGRVLLDGLGGRNHAYAGGNRIAFFAHGALQLPGVTGNYASMPDSGFTRPFVDPLGWAFDFDFRAYAALDNWAPGTTMALFSKWQNAVVQNYVLAVTATGALQLWWSTNGTDSHSATSTATLGLANFEAKWVRATIDCDNHAGGYTVQFYTSDDNNYWTDLGDPVIGVGTTSFAPSNSIVEFGSRLGGSSWPLAGKIFRVQLRRSKFDQLFDTQLQFDINFAGVTDGATTYNDRDHVIVPFQGLVGRGTIAGPVISTPNRPEYDAVVDMDVRVELTPLSEGLRSVVCAWTAPYTALAWFLEYYVYDRDLSYVYLQWATNGSPLAWGVNLFQDGGFVGPAAGERSWIRVTLDANDGSGGRVFRTWRSVDNVNWQMVTEVVTPGGATTIYTGAHNGLELGTFAGGNWSFNGIIHQLDWRDAIDGDSIAKFDLTGQPPNETSLTDTLGHVWTVPDVSNTVTIHQTAATSAEPKYLPYTSGSRYVWLPGIVGNYLSAPDEAALDITGDIDVRVELAMEDWTPAATQLLLAKRASSLASAACYWFYVNTNGTLAFEWSDGSSNRSAVSTVAVGGTDKTALHVRATLDVDNGASGRSVRFYKSTDGVSWTQIGTTVTQSGTTSIRSGSEILEIGSQYTGTSGPLAAAIYGAKVYNGIAGTLVFEFDAAADLADQQEPYDTFPAATGQTMTAHRATTGVKTVVVDRSLFVMGTNDYFEVADAAEFDFAAADDFSVAVTARTYDLPAGADQALLAKRAAVAGTGAGWDMYVASGAVVPRFAIGDGSTAVAVNMPTLVSGGSFSDDFARSDRTLDGDNGWDAPAEWAIVSGKAVVTTDTAGAPTVATHASVGSGHWAIDAHVPNPMTPSLVYSVTSILGVIRWVAADENVLWGLQIIYEADGTTWNSGSVYCIAQHPTLGTSVAFVSSLVGTVAPGGAVAMTLDLDDTTGDVTVVVNGETFTGTLDLGVLSGLTSTAAGLYTVSDSMAPAVTQTAALFDSFAEGAGTYNPKLWRTAVAVRDANLTGYMNGAASTPVADTTSGSLANAEAVRIGRLSGAGTGYAGAEFAAAAIWRAVLTPADAGRLRTEMAQ